MDIITLASTAYIFAKPFLEKTGEGIARKIGEDIWNLIKKPFIEKGTESIETTATADPEAFTKELQKHLQDDEAFAAQLTELLSNSQNLLSGNLQQNINSYGKIEKQINIQTYSGNIQM